MSIKEVIWRKLKQEFSISGLNLRKLRLFRITGLEFLEQDNFEVLQKNDLIFYSFGKLPYI